ncbi:MAG: hypothetical protein COT17_07495 [Elusimicrobia bacterium CG08_land_8_20_14_0_20_51_18]|nr:MAG: hypothetical protein COT17_07495 [Elusimicrobia bacterium CG08_land_8_20_14_0_20_51_18]
MNIPPETRIEDITFTFLDVETTGLSPERERICEVAIISFRDFKQVYSFSTLINPQKKIPPEITRINGINDEMVKDKPAFPAAVPKIMVALENSVVVGHNVNFDRDFLVSEFSRCGFQMPSLHFVDTLLIARKFGKFSNNRLGNIARQLEISNENWHRALSDVEMTSKIFEHFMVIFKKEGVNSLHDLLKKLKE